MPSPHNGDPDSLQASAHFAAYDGAVGNTDLVNEGKAPCRAIRAAGEGTLVVKRASDKQNVTLRFLAGETQVVSACELVAAGSTATNLTVYW